MKKILILIVLVPTLYVNYLVYNSLVIQRDLLIEFNQQNYKESTTASFNTFNMELPSIGVTTIPIKHLVSKYFFLSEDYERALELIEQGNKENPYIKSGSMFKSEIFEHLGIQDSAFYYSNDAFNKMPGTPRHYVYYTKNLVKRGMLKELLDSYKKVENFKSPKFHINFIVSLREILNDKKIDSLEKKVIKIRNRFPNDEKIRIASDHYLYGIENINKSLEYSQIANKFYTNGQLNEAIFNFKKASELNPSDYVNFENVGYLYIEKKMYEESLPYLYEVLEKKIRNIKGKSEFLLGVSLLNLDSINKACLYFSKAKELNFPDSYRYLSEYCN